MTAEKLPPLPSPSPLSRPIKLRDLPSADTGRWVVRRKAQVVAAVRTGILTLEDACARYNLSVEEFQAWEQSLSRHGLRGLQTTRLGHYRPKLAAAADD